MVLVNSLPFGPPPDCVLTVRVRRVALLAEEFSIEKGEMTPTLKVKRPVIDQKYGTLIDELYRG